MNPRKLFVILIVVGLLSLVGSSIAFADDGDVHLPFMSSNNGQPSIRTAGTGDGGSDVFLPMISGEGAPVVGAGSNTVTVLKSGGGPLAGVPIYYNDYGNHWVNLGTTGATGQVVVTLPDGNYKLKAVKDKTQQVMNGVPVPGSVTFQTAKFTVHVKHTDGTNFAGIKASFNDYGNHYVSMGNTDANGNAFIELFPGTRKFKAYKDHTADTGETTADIEFQTAKFTVHVEDSGGADFAGIKASFNDYGNHYLSMGNTDGSGLASIELFPGTRKFKAYKDHTADTGNLTNNAAGTNKTIDFQTAKAIGVVKDCDGTPLEGFKVSFNDYGNHWLTMGTTGVDGKASIELFPGTRKIQASIDKTYEAKDLTLTLTENTVEFNPTKVNFVFNGTVKYNDYGNHWKTMTSPFYMFPGTYDFSFDGVQTEVTVAGCSMDNTVVILSLKGHSGQPLAGGKARYGVGSNFGSWHVPGATGTDGLLVHFAKPGATTLSYEMRFNNTTEVKTQDVSVNSLVEFDTNLLTLRMETCGGDPLDGGSPRYGNGATYTSWWFPGGATGSSAPGESAAEVFPGTYSFQIQYKATADAKISEVIPDADHMLTWTTTKVTLDYNGAISYGGSTGDSKHFTKPSMELLPGTYKFHFRYVERVDLTLSGCEFTKSYVALTVLDENGNGVAGGKARPAYGGSWGTTLAGATDANGKLFSEIPPGYTKIRMTVNQGSEQQSVAQLNASNYTWYTEILRIWLNTSTGLPIPDEQAILKQGGGYWYTWGNLNASGYRDIQLFPRTSAYKFKMNYQFTSQELFPVVSVTPGIQDFDFQTGRVFGSCITQYSASGWQTFFEGIELMPSTLTFRYPSQSGTVTAGVATYLTCP